MENEMDEKFKEAKSNGGLNIETYINADNQSTISNVSITVGGISTEEKFNQNLFESISNHIIRLYEKKNSQASLKQPYKFLDYYQLDDWQYFPGRKQSITELFEIVTNQKISVLHAKSGAGKTSLINAGLLPVLLDKQWIPYVIRVDGRPPTIAIKQNIFPFNGNIHQEIINKLSLNEFFNVVEKVKKNVEGLSKKTGLIIILDQFEEFFVFWPDKNSQQNFIKELSECINEHNLSIHFLISLRKDFFSDLGNFQELIPEIFNHQIRLGSLSREEAKYAIKKPLENFQKKIDPLLLNKLLDNFENGGNELPHLQIVCNELYKNFGEENEVRLEHYNMLGANEGILNSYLKNTLEKLPEEQIQLAKSILKELVSSKATNRSTDYQTLETRIANNNDNFRPSLLRKSLTYLVNERLIRRRTSNGGGLEIYEMSHEALITQIEDWIDNESVKVKEVQELLERELQTWRLHPQGLIPVDRFRIINENRTYLSSQTVEEAQELLLISSLNSRIDPEYWWGNADLILKISSVKSLLTNPDAAIYDHLLTIRMLIMDDNVCDSERVSLFREIFESNERIQYSLALEIVDYLGFVNSLESLELLGSIVGNYSASRTNSQTSIMYKRAFRSIWHLLKSSTEAKKNWRLLIDKKLGVKQSPLRMNKISEPILFFGIRIVSIFPLSKIELIQTAAISLMYSFWFWAFIGIIVALPYFFAKSGSFFWGYHFGIGLLGLVGIIGNIYDEYRLREVWQRKPKRENLFNRINQLRRCMFPILGMGNLIVSFLSAWSIISLVYLYDLVLYEIGLQFYIIVLMVNEILLLLSTVRMRRALYNG